MSAVLFRGLAVVGLGLTLGFGSATIAAPTPKAIPGPEVVHVELEDKQLGHWSLASGLQQATVEPGGLEVVASSTDWFPLGFKAGDVIMAENGIPVGERMFYVSDGMHVFDVLRNNKP